MRKAFIQAVRAELDGDPDLVVFLGDISVAGFLQPNDELLGRVYNCGILEQAMVSFAAGCAASGLYPIVQTIIPFLVERAFEQIKLDFCAQKNPGLLVGVGGGLEYSKLGYTHHCLWDTALLSQLEGLTLFTPTIGPHEVAETLPVLIRSRRLAYARLTENYFSGSSVETARPFNLCPVRAEAAGSSRRATVLCGSFPGMQAVLAAAEGPVFAYSYPGSLPENISELSMFEELHIWEFGTVPILSNILRNELRGKRITGYYQAPRFFRDYGGDAAQRFIASNWLEYR